MTDLLSELNTHLLPGWNLTAIIYNFNHEGWEVTAWDIGHNHAVMQHGHSIEDALFKAYYAIEHADYWAPNATRSTLATAASDILSIIGLKPKAQPIIKRRGPLP